MNIAYQDPYFKILEQQCHQRRYTLPPWTSTDHELLAIAHQYFPEIPIYPSNQLENPDLTPVTLLPLSHFTCPQLLHDQQDYFVAVGGPPAATVGLQAAMEGKPVLYIYDHESHSSHKQALPIWSGAGNHGEPDFLTEAPAYVLGHKPFPFIFKEFLRWLKPKNIKQITDPDHPWLSLNITEWLKTPRQWPAGCRVAWGNHQQAKLYQQDNTHILEIINKRVHDSERYLQYLNQELGKLIRDVRGSLIIASSPQQLAVLQKMAQHTEEQLLIPLTEKEAEHKYGIKPRGALALMEKKHDFIFEYDFLATLIKGIKTQGGQVINYWRLARIFIDTDKKIGGILEFYELTAQGKKKFHYRKFQHAHLSLGATPFIPKVYDLISVTGVTMNALVFGAKLKGGPIVCGGTNHMVPLLPPRTIHLPSQCEGISFVRLSAAGCINPLDRGKHWYDYNAHHALHLLHRVQETLPDNVSIRVLSARGCNRVIGKDGYQVELHPNIVVKGKKFTCHAVTIQIGAGGGGLTQMGAIPQQMMNQWHNKNKSYNP